MKIINLKTSTAVLSFATLVFPTVALGAGLIPCGDVVDANNIVTNPCGFDDIIVLANRIVTFLMYDVVVPLVAIGLMYTGGRLILFQDKEAEWTSAKSRFGDIGMGFAIILGSFVLIKFILMQFLDTEAGFFLYLIQ